jgi:hypothetical protein
VAAVPKVEATLLEGPEALRLIPFKFHELYQRMYIWSRWISNESLWVIGLHRNIRTQRAARNRLSLSCPRAARAGTTPALAAVINASLDALAEFGVRHIETPARPERVWRAIQAACLDI